MDRYKRIKLEVFIPETHLKQLQETLRKIGAGKVGNYDSCTSYSRVKGTWRPLQGSNPYDGKEGEISEGEEVKVEVVIDGNCAKETVEAIKEIHPYEEPLINLIPLLSLTEGTR